MSRDVYVVGAGLTRFVKPGTGGSYVDLAREAAVRALEDARLTYADVQQVCAGYVYGDSTRGQRVVYELGMTGIPVYNLNNNCSTGSTAIFLAKQLIEGGAADCVLALGFEAMKSGALELDTNAPAHPLYRHMERIFTLRGRGEGPVAAQIFGNAGREHMEKHGTTPQHFAKVAAKNHRHSRNNPYAQFQTEFSVEEILQSPPVFAPLTRLQCCPTSDGAAAVVVASGDFVRSRALTAQAVRIAGMAMATDVPGTFDSDSCIDLAGAEMSRLTARRAYEQSGYGPENIDVIELHDCFSTNELITYEALGLCPPGKAGDLIDSGAVTYGGQWVVNPSGGLISKGHPLGASGIAQSAELCWQLRGNAGERQVENAKTALQHNLGLGGAAVVTVYRAPESVQVSRS